MYLEFVTSKAVQIQNMASKISKLINTKVELGDETYHVQCFVEIWRFHFISYLILCPDDGGRR